MIGLDALGIAAATLPAAVAIHHALDRAEPTRWRNAGFWGVFALLLGVGPWLPDLANGCLVLVMVGLATWGLHPVPPAPSSAEAQGVQAARLGNWLFVPALAIPLVTLAGTLSVGDGRIAGAPVIDPKQVTLVALTIGAVVALVLAMRLTRLPRSAPVAEARRLVDAIGWAIVLPQMLAALGGVFALAGVGKVVADGVVNVVALDTPLLATIAYCVGMALFTMVMGNAFAAFPIMTAGIGLPIVIRQFGGDPAIVAALGMLSGFCGTLMTPMAANFNIVPAAILELRDRFGVIRVQWPTAIVLLVFNIAVLALCAFPGGLVR
ncbi:MULTISPECIES: DUF979 domain-containing protein [Sphingomonas]|jgi:uncharacterized membrane protein|uniref:DUF979 domain-containing protein n=1 Tax=Sphingomonas hankookensis TaxID=563996 RepID=A0ABR5YDI4_9SPHN|nr:MULTISPECIES: DUF979 domain-containing protein [Sphingomonas]KZE16018.1 hypothetical protein AVT10_13010 [Sphingomonas hankookensis]PZT92873.1 MAG: DUF979 domain-containing protein [Sphingomonas sp.]RSV28982.1 DUF979 domain-containing protein [Sphingomonas sp. ABOLH]WCP71496.1 DUF979 domain-containing protein [Sphingomonas hankookensis]